MTQPTREEIKEAEYQKMINAVKTMTPEQLNAVLWVFGYPTNGADAWTVDSLVDEIRLILWGNQLEKLGEEDYQSTKNLKKPTHRRARK